MLGTDLAVIGNTLIAFVTAPQPPFVKRLDDRGAWGYDELIALARESFAVKSGSGTSSP